ncbi:Phosphatidylglycerol/phosphatidylinositol transfer protein [Yarrowia sp. C11]|nr:Phosphatidylglycerol/phosphatidylinositol transfer protein [Yarrowia sp. C11]KAG5358723.1 Phosphatidylglycerol/phosphatidylinositol transfer protein [Yarrowia sp. E02]
MKLLSIASAVCLATATLAADSNIEFILSKFLGLDSFVPKNCHAVPGNVKFLVCDRPDPQAINISAVDSSVYPFPAGKEVEIEIVGRVDHVVQEGAYLNVSVYSGFHQVHAGVHPLCNLMKQHKIGKGCPLKPTKKDIRFKRKVTIPDWIPSARYFVLGTIYNPDKTDVISFSGQYDVKGTPETDAEYHKKRQEEDQRRHLERLANDKAKEEQRLKEEAEGGSKAEDAAQDESAGEPEEPYTVKVEDGNVEIKGEHAEQLLDLAEEAAGIAEELISEQQQHEADAEKTDAPVHDEL